MTTIKRRLALTKKVSLADIADGWDECYAIVRLADYQEYRDFSDLDIASMSKSEQVSYEMNLVKEHFVNGKILVLTDDGESKLEDMVPADVESAVQLADKLFYDILGITLSPKDLSPAA